MSEIPTPLREFTEAEQSLQHCERTKELLLQVWEEVKEIPMFSGDFLTTYSQQIGFIEIQIWELNHQISLEQEDD